MLTPLGNFEMYRLDSSQFYTTGYFYVDQDGLLHDYGLYLEAHRVIERQNQIYGSNLTEYCREAFEVCKTGLHAATVGSGAGLIGHVIKLSFGEKATDNASIYMGDGGYLVARIRKVEFIDDIFDDLERSGRQINYKNLPVNAPIKPIVAIKRAVPDGIYRIARVMQRRKGGYVSQYIIQPTFDTGYHVDIRMQPADHFHHELAIGSKITIQLGTQSGTKLVTSAFPRYVELIWRDK